MEKREMETLLRWVRENTGKEDVDVGLIFRTALYHQTGKIDPWRLRQCLYAYKFRGRVPDFVVKFLQQVVFKPLIKRGRR